MYQNFAAKIDRRWIWRGMEFGRGSKGWGRGWGKGFYWPGRSIAIYLLLRPLVVWSSFNTKNTIITIGGCRGYW